MDSNQDVALMTVEETNLAIPRENRVRGSRGRKQAAH